MSDVMVPGAKVLDVGSGSGYLCAAFFEMMDRKGHVVGIEHIQELVNDSIENLKKSYGPQLLDGSISVKCGDGRLGC